MKIGLAGTMSVGKTTLVNALAQDDMFKYSYKFFTERSKELKNMGIPLNKNSTLIGQMCFMMERLRELQHFEMIADRTLIDVLSFTLCSTEIPDDEKQILKNYTKELVEFYDVIFYIPMILPLENNGVRETDEAFRKEIDNKILELLNEFKIPYVHITSLSIEDRVEEIKTWVIGES